MGCDRVVIASTMSQGAKTTVTWLTYKMAGLEGFLLTLVQNGAAKSFDAAATDLSLTVDYTAVAGCTAAVTPRTAGGPSNDHASFATPVPFPPTPIDPNAGRPVVLRACVDAGNVTVNWIPSTLNDPDAPLLGNYLSIVQNQTSLNNFDVPDNAVTTTTVAYVVDPGSTYQVILTPYDEFGINRDAASYPGSIPYP
jgi:hypothetical protein